MTSPNIWYWSRALLALKKAWIFTMAPTCGHTRLLHTVTLETEAGEGQRSGLTFCLKNLSRARYFLLANHIFTKDWICLRT